MKKNIFRNLKENLINIKNYKKNLESKLNDEISPKVYVYMRTYMKDFEWVREYKSIEFPFEIMVIRQEGKLDFEKNFENNNVIIHSDSPELTYQIVHQEYCKMALECSRREALKRITETYAKKEELERLKKKEVK